MQFTEEQIDEIRREYREAAYPDEQVHISAELNACEPIDIARILGLGKVPKRVNSDMLRVVHERYDWDAIYADIDDGLSKKDVAAKYGVHIGHLYVKLRQRDGRGR